MTFLSKIREWILRIRECGVSGVQPWQASKIRFLNTAAGVALLALGLNFLLDGLSGRVRYPLWFLVHSFQGVVLLVIVSHQYRAYRLAKFLFLVVFPTLFLSGNLVCAFIGTENYLFVTLIIGFKVLDKKSSMVLLTLYYALLYGSIVWGMDSGYLTAGDLPRYYYYVNSLLSLGVVAWLTYHYSKQVQYQMDSLEGLNHDLQKKNALSHHLLRELNHRVKNNLQMIGSLFNLQWHASNNPETRLALSEARSRLDSIAILHQKLYQESSIFSVDIHEYLQSVCEHLQPAHSNTRIEMLWKAPSRQLAIKETIYLGLIVNELVTNALKYAQTNNPMLNIEVIAWEETHHFFCLEVNDNGSGWPTALNTPFQDSFGLELVQTLVEPYDGFVKRYNKPQGGAGIRVGMRLIPQEAIKSR